MAKDRIAVELDDETLRLLAELGQPADVLARLAHAAAEGVRRPDREWRDQTDESLRIERRRADVTLAQERDAIEHAADEVVRVARASADRLVQNARHDADEPRRPASTAAGERTRADDLLEEERSQADEALLHERAARRRGPDDLLAVERKTTDTDLTGERAHADALIVDQRQANEQMVSATLQAHDAADAADAAKARAEERERELRTVAELREMFIGVLGHDLRNPLAAITTAAVVLHECEQLEGTAATATARILRNAHHMSRMITQLLDLTRARLGGGMPLEPAPTDLREICAHTIDEFDARVQPDLAGDLTGTWDRDRLAEVLSNLVGNALQYATPGTPVIVKAHAEGAEVVVEVLNQGEPIPADVLPFIFEPFRRARQRTRSATGNLGLGLYIAAQIVLSHGGTLDAHSAGGTTTFVMRLPRRSPTGSAPGIVLPATSPDSVLVEVDTLRRTEQAVRDSDARYRTMFESTSVGVCEADAETGRLLRVNEQFAQIAGYRASALVGMTFLELIHPDDRPGYREGYARLERDEVAFYQLEKRLVRPDGTIVWVYTTVNILPLDAGRARHAVAITVDITERKRLESELRQRGTELAEADQRKNEFLAMLGHELRNPLSALAHGLDLLGQSPDDRARSDELRGIMVRHLQRIGALLDQLLDIDRVISGKVELANARVDVAEVVHAAVAIVAPLMAAQRHELVVTLPPGERAFVRGDGFRLTQVVEQLLSNAAKYTGDGGRIVLSLEIHPDEIRIMVRDTGIGMDVALLPHIFELFTQAPRTLDRAKGGLGLGLPLVQRLVEIHGGRVHATSAGLGHGSELVVALPRLRDAPAAAPASTALASASTAPASTAPAPASTAPREPRPRRILVVDDEDEMAWMFASLLQRDGHQTLAVTDGRAALAAVPTFDPEVVLLDLGLPELDGYEIARRLRAGPRGAELLLIAVTGYQSDATRLAEAGFDHHLIKPPDRRKLAALLAAWDQRQPVDP